MRKTFETSIIKTMKLTKNRQKTLPETNNEQVLEFVFGKDPNLFLRKNKILIFGSVSVDSNYIPESGFAAKLFNMLTVEIESHHFFK